VRTSDGDTKADEEAVAAEEDKADGVFLAMQLERRERQGLQLRRGERMQIRLAAQRG
jgi:hypothetical protein